jgi:hypothetical protein
MCCATTKAAFAVGGMRLKTSTSAVGPPVDEPITTMLRGSLPSERATASTRGS